jgi:hypothetical protein
MASVQANAGVIYTFGNITGNDVANAAAGESQLAVEVDAVGLNQVSFKFTNAGPAAMSITDIYFDDGTLLGIASIINGGSGVNFSQGASPGNLPGGNALSPAFQTTAGFSADSNPPAQPNGVNPGEMVTIIFTLINGMTFADTINALNTPGDHLRIGIHVQGFANGGSESFVNRVPAPGALALLGLGGLAAARRRR